ncbi:MAG: UDP-N-acetylmuramate:L-alanyl-gamma-D-glutamyl-meso-diaminopimelate ligase [Gammaproteobacteria bacterium]|jgi:UDP-N-acetylmuramate: L-alanyl-gamma-D-glutamyl-meso-diaminopimelate ligase|nr:UDP-N-acetylmuramate:L-alanyl-gamma-D-glutamyl-meso-diaminopimelate ligase [Gammaproteobacteria bacterium]
MPIHILGICGTFMGGIALIARESGYEVSGSDSNVYPPMSTQLEAAGIQLLEGYEANHIPPGVDCVIVGNVMTRGNPVVEHILNEGVPYDSGPRWLGQHVLAGRHVLAVAGTHGKTTTSSLLAWILEVAGLNPGFLVGGVPRNFGLSARLTDSPYFVIEADEYDTAFFDKRSKFIHYAPRTLVLTNLEFDHADIFEDLGAIQRQFHHLIRVVPGRGLVVSKADDANLEETLAMGCWTPRQNFSIKDASAEWQAELLSTDGSRFSVTRAGGSLGTVDWEQTGVHNVENALAALAAAAHVGVDPPAALDAMTGFLNARRRLEVVGRGAGVTIYDDFAHHPTAIRLTLEGLKARIGRDRLIAVLEPRSNSMRMGVHRDGLAGSLSPADRVYLCRPKGLAWDLGVVARELGGRGEIVEDAATLVDTLPGELCRGDHVVFMSNGGFGGLPARIAGRMETRGRVS